MRNNDDEQLILEGWLPSPKALPNPSADEAFDGETYEPEEDHIRLKGQLSRVYNLMFDGRWRTLSQIVEEVGGSEAAVSARLRDLRKEKYGAREVLRERIKGGLYRYRLVLKVEQRA